MLKTAVTGAVGGSLIGACIGAFGYTVRKRRMDGSREEAAKRFPMVKHESILCQIASIYSHSVCERSIGRLGNALEGFYSHLGNRDDMILLNRKASELSEVFASIHKRAQCASPEARGLSEDGNPEYFDSILDAIIHNECLNPPVLE